MKFQLWMITPAVTSYSPTFGVVRYRGPRAVIQFLCRTLCNLCSSSSNCYKWLQPVSLWKGKNVVHATHWQRALPPSTWIHHTPCLESSQIPKVWKSGVDLLPSPSLLCVHTQCTFSRRGWRINLRSSRSLLDKSSTSTIRRPPWTGDTRRRKGKEDFVIIQKMAGGGKSLGNLILETTWHATLPSKGAAGSLGRRKAWGGRMQSRITRKSSRTGN